MCDCLVLHSTGCHEWKSADSIFAELANASHSCVQLDYVIGKVVGNSPLSV